MIKFYIKIVIFLFAGILLNTSCVQKTNKTKKTPQDKRVIKCSNDESLYKSINNKELLYLDSLNITYLKLKSRVLKSNKTQSDCQKLPYVFIREIVIKDSITLIQNIIDVNSFEKMPKSEGFFMDKNNVYVYQESPATYPPFISINVNPKEALVFNDEYIKDSKNVYYRGVLLSNNASHFQYIPNKENLNLFGDTKNIIWNWSKLNYKDFEELALSKRKHDSLQKIYFSKQ